MSATRSSRFSGLNSTAYRLFKLLQWLCVEPLSFEQINLRFKTESKIKQSISQDTVWLYLNTLKLLGCEISRPSASNQFTYQLLTHPFGLSLNPETLEVLALLKQELEDVLSYKEQLTLDQLAKALIDVSNSNDKARDIKKHFEGSRSLDYAPFESLIATLEEAVETEQLLSLVYDSPIQGKHLLEVLPQELYYSNGTLLLLVCREADVEATQLRVDRIVSAEPSLNTEQAWVKACKERKHKEPSIKLQVICPSLNAWLPLVKNEQVTLLEKQEQACLLEVTLSTHNEFALIQRLLQLPFPFEVLYPQALKEKLQKQLKPMFGYYQTMLSAWDDEALVEKSKQAKNTHSNPYQNRRFSPSVAFTALEAFNYE